MSPPRDLAGTSGLVEAVAAPAGGLVPGSRATVDLAPAGAAPVQLTVSIGSADPPAIVAAKQELLACLQAAQQAGWPVTVDLPPGGTEIEAVTLGGFDVSPVGAVVQGDFFTVTGRQIPADVSVVFDSAAGTRHFSPHLVRPDWLFVAQFPHAIPAGRYTMWLASAAWSSDAVPVDVLPGPAATVRALNPGAPTAAPYTIAFVANPAYIPSPVPPAGSAVDPVVARRPPFHAGVRFCLENLLEAAEDVVRQFDPDVRFVAVFDAAAPEDASALLEEHPAEPTILWPRREVIQAFVAARGLAADVVFVLHGSPTYDRAAGVAATDDGAGGIAFTYDGGPGLHGFACRLPGTVALPVGAARGPIALHEFCHAAADTVNGVVVDLYVDTDLPAFPAARRVNKKWRRQPADPVPPDFAEYEGTRYAADPRRDGLAYPSGWTSYHPEPLDGAQPNLMDVYGRAEDPMRCRLDRLTRAWLGDRLRAKLSR